MQKRHSKENTETGKNLIWGRSSEFSLLGIKFSVNLEKMKELNFDPLIVKTREVLSKWKKDFSLPWARSQF